MKINLKNKIMLAVLAGGMLCANGAFAEDIWWYGKQDGFVDAIPSPAVTTGINLTITDSTQVSGKTVADVNKEIYGGYSNGSEDVKNNSITFNTTNAATINANIYGAYTDSGNASGNSVNIKNGTFSGKIYGSRINNSSTTGIATKNSVNIADGTFSGMIYGGYNYGSTATKNSVVIDGGTFSNPIYGAQGRGVDGNSVTINNGTFKGNVFGGNATNSIAATNNTVTINNGVFDVDNKYVYGGVSSGGDVTGNKVIINDGQFTGTNIWAGTAMYTPSGNATKNIVTIKGGTFNDIIIYGGISNTGNATGNTVNIEGGTFNTIKNLYGGSVGNTGTSSNNTLNLKIKLGGTSTEVGYFQTMNFTLPSNITKNDIMLSTANVTYDNTLIGVTAKTGVKLNKDEVIYLIKSENTPIGTISNDGAYVLDGAAIVKLDGNNLILTLLEDFEQKEPEPPQSNEDKQKAPVEGIAATVAMINQSADLASNEGLNNLAQNTADGTFDTFGAINANRSKYKTGSHVDMDGWGFLVGAGNTRNWKNGEKTTYGLFFEYGKGEFDTYNNDIHGDGDSNNKGVGIIARHTLNNNTYFDGAIRYGKQETEWSESEIGGYETDSKYFGTSLGIGHIYPIGKNELDIYGRYTYGHTGSCDAKVGENEYKFDSVKSSRLRVGTKLNIIVKGKKVKPYVGVAWEREMKGESRATITGVGEAPAPSLKGNTGIMQAGCSWEAGKWTLGAEANAYIGKRKGWGAMFNAFYNF